MHADAIRYISLFAKLTMYQNAQNQSSSEIVKELLAEEGDLYTRFHPVFSVIAPREKVNAFNKHAARILPPAGGEMNCGQACANFGKKVSCNKWQCLEK